MAERRGLRGEERYDESSGRSNRSQKRSLAHDDGENISALRSQGEPNSHLARSLHRGIGDNSIQADGGEEKSQSGKDAQQDASNRCVEMDSLTYCSIVFTSRSGS